MNGQVIYVVTLVFFLLVILFLQKKFHLLEDSGSKALVCRPYSFSRVQLVWWSFIVLSSIVAIVWGSGNLPDLLPSTLVLLGIGSLTTIAGNITDLSDDNKVSAAQATQATSGAAPVTTNGPTKPEDLSRNQPSQGFLLDILSDKNGVSIHRLQAVVFNTVFGIWFMYRVFERIKNIGPVSAFTDDFKNHLDYINSIIPFISQNNLILMGMSSGTYIALKTTENSQPSVPTASPSTNPGATNVQNATNATNNLPTASTNTNAGSLNAAQLQTVSTALATDGTAAAPTAQPGS